MKTPKYLDIVANSFNEAKAWRTATLTSLAISIALVAGMVYMAGNQPTVLVPFEFATASGPVKVATNGSMRGTSSEYLVNIGLSDLSLVTNFTPSTVVIQYERFLNRLTEDTFATQHTALRAEAEALKKENAIQAFFPNEKTSVSSDLNTVVIQGTLIRWAGDREVLRTDTTYTLSYTHFKGYFHLSAIASQNTK